MAGLPLPLFSEICDELQRQQATHEEGAFAARLRRAQPWLLEGAHAAPPRCSRLTEFTVWGFPKNLHS